MTVFEAIVGFFRSVFNGLTTTTTTTRAIIPGQNKRAICVGINDYPGTENDLGGCVNDANGWKSLLNSRGFCVNSMLNSEATNTNVLNAIRELITTAIPGDELFITYSGHGSIVPDMNGDEEDGRDETWYLYNGNLTDDSLREILVQLPQGVKLTIVSDSCHSGTVTRAFLGAISTKEIYCKAKYMPPKDDMVAISTNMLPVKKAICYPEEGMNYILLAGCKSTEYSYDTSFNDISMGAMSHYALEVLKNNCDITYNDFYAKLRENLPSAQYPQTPQLEGNEILKNNRVF